MRGIPFQRRVKPGRKHRARKKDEDVAVLNVAVDKGLPPRSWRHLKKRNQSEPSVKTRRSWSTLFGLRRSSAKIAHLAKLELERSVFDASIPRVLVTERMRPRTTRVLPRGNWMDNSGEIVQPAVPAFLGKVAGENGEATRLDLANWIVSKENPLTARVFVIRTWREFFGTGLSKVLESLGSQGEMPTHPNSSTGWPLSSCSRRRLRHLPGT